MTAHRPSYEQPHIPVPARSLCLRRLPSVTQSQASKAVYPSLSALCRALPAHCVMHRLRRITILSVALTDLTITKYRCGFYMGTKILPVYWPKIRRCGFHVGVACSRYFMVLYHLATKMTYTVSSGTLNSSIPYHTIPLGHCTATAHTEHWCPHLCMLYMLLLLNYQRMCNCIIPGMPILLRQCSSGMRKDISTVKTML